MNFIGTVATVCLFLIQANAETSDGGASSTAQEPFLVYHAIQTDSNNFIVPWNNPDPAQAYDQILNLTWTYWNNIPGYWMRKEPDFKKRFGIRYPPLYLLFRTQDPADLGVGGGQFAQLLSSFNLYYDYSGNPLVLTNMVFLADWYIQWGFSDSGCAWPNSPLKNALFSQSRELDERSG